MALPSSSLSSQIHTGATTQCIPHFHGSLNAGTSAGKRRSLYLRWGKGPSKIVACAGQDPFSVPTLVKREFPPGFWKDHVIESLMPSYKVAPSDEKRIETLITEIKNMFRSMGYGETNPSAYDTAWVARIPAVDGSEKPQFPETLEWILQNQLKDGSWGEEFYFLAYDRILATLACIITLTIWQTGDTQVQKGIEFFKTQAGKIEEEADSHRPSGFEIVFPAMLKEAKALGLALPYELPFIQQIIEKREAKLQRLPSDLLYALPTTLLYSLEGLQEIVDWEKIMKLQSKDRSFLSSPSSTAAVFMRTGNKKCLEFLNFVLKKFGNHVPCHYPLDLFERLWAVDTVERLGIDHHFKEEIKDALDYVYSHWDERGIGWARENPVPDIDDTAMGLRILRLHGYNVSSDVLKTFRDENGEFFCFLGQTQRGVTDMLNVNRCSHVAFPGETIMEEAKLCTERYLRNALEDTGAFDKWALKKNIRGEVEYALKYPWHRSMPRLEARSYIENYGPNDVWLGKTMYMMPNISNEKYLELAKLDFNRVQFFHRQELQDIRRWWNSSGFSQLGFTRERVAEIYFSPASFLFEPEFATCRAVYTKTSNFTVILDDLYDAHGTLDNLKLFSESVKRWDLSLVDQMPQDMKICFKGFYNTFNEIAEEGRKRQGRDVLSYIQKVWEVQLEAYTKEAEWSAVRYVPSYDEYIENASVSIALGTVVLISALFTGEILTDDILSKIGRDSRFLYLMGLTGRLVNDTKTYQAERGQGEVASAVQCYMKDHPEISEEEALKHVYTIMDNALDELNREFVNNRDVPDTCRRLVFETARIMQLFYMDGDGLTLSHNMEIKEHVKNCLFQPVA
uniref:Bifunctional levopimaradiene synthase, chloroplastic n=1 Tax=Pinus contorta TaxID=3339 RepID=TPSD2_PINCO|nr:RecName: Full=Bifunctional levopimaradiene synthase, chloroplastic; Short=PcLAS2; AltName: Full=Diterpene synthase; Includes: RecName: Full=Levopimaradiene synthase; AltName: Full=Abieta-7,13-diene synthase; AltName: Full=Neoabietadiene synthase; Includes: RecName: Full=Copalyl diphosphate synthase; Flags: Precursor [Pinus contorta]AFU73863.1 levopimaradiene/abietadiene synthase [Pinus contorta]